MKVTQEWIAPLFFNRLSEKQKHTVFYCPFTAHKAPGVGFCPSEAFHGQVHISPAPRSVGAQRRREDPRPPCVKGKAYQLHGWPHLSGMQQGHGTKVASFLCKESTTCPENCCLTLKWQRRTVHEKQFPSLTFVFIKQNSVLLWVLSFFGQTLKKSPAYSLVKTIYCSGHLYSCVFVPNKCTYQSEAVIERSQVYRVRTLAPGLCEM